MFMFLILHHRIKQIKPKKDTDITFIQKAIIFFLSDFQNNRKQIFDAKKF